MPSSMTHTYFTIDVYNSLPKKYTKYISNLEYLKLFAQGSDPLMFYNYLIGKKATYYKNVQYILHTSKTQDYFINLINYINDNNLSKNEQVLSYLYGNICHYFLDLKTHPFIIYKTGIFQKNNKNTYKYNARHQEMEYIIDMYFIKIKENISPQKFPIHNKIFKYNKLNKELLTTIDYTIEKTYNLKNITTPYIKSIKNMKIFFRLFNYDKYGIKKNIYSTIDNITKDSTIKLKELSYSNNYQEKLDYLNLEKKQWNNPTNKKETYNYSFIDLYNQAIDLSKVAIIEVSNMLLNKKINNTKLKNIFNNLSYTTGKDCNKNLESKYFEY